VENRKLKKKKKRICSEVSAVYSPGNPWSEVSPAEDKEIRLEGFADKESFKPRMKERGGDRIAY